MVTVVAAAVYRSGRMIVQALVAGLAWGATALCSRAAVSHVRSLGDALSSPVVYALVLSGAVGVVLYARALEHGHIGPPTAALWVTEVVVPGLLGLWLLGDTTRPGWAWAAGAGVALAVAGCVVLAQSEATGRAAA